MKQTLTAKTVSIVGNCREVLDDLPERSVQTVVTSPPYFGLRSYLPADSPLKKLEIGSESRLEDYVGGLVDVFRSVRRVLRDDGTVWLNLGDSYNAAGRKGSNGLKPKDLMGVPWRVALALQADGWYLRQDIIWHKPSPMPSSVKDRCTTAHEYLFLLSKLSDYYYDAEGIKERSVDKESLTGRRKRKKLALLDSEDKGYDGHRTAAGLMKLDGQQYPTRNKRDVWSVDSNANRGGECIEIIKNTQLTDEQKWESIQELLDDGSQSSVWRVASRGYKGAHFACFPPKLIEPCILAGTSEVGCCADCGSPLRRVVDSKRTATRPGTDTKVTGDSTVDGNRDPRRHVTSTETVGWRRDCDCDTEATRPCVVLDPFGGSGTTAEVSESLGRDCVLIDLNSDYVDLQRKRLKAA